MNLTVECMYTCHACGVTKRKVAVPAREAGEDIVSWTKASAFILGKDHRRVSPRCKEVRCDLYISIAPDGRVGEATKQ